MIVIPLTTARRGLSLHVEVEADADAGLDATSYIQCEMIRSINQNRLDHRLGAVDVVVMKSSVYRVDADGASCLDPVPWLAPFASR